MPFCEHCGNEIGYLPFKCRYCGGTMCNKHRLPENHECTFELKHTPIVPITSRESRTKYQDVTVKRATPGGYDRRREKEVKKYLKQQARQSRQSMGGYQSGITGMGDTKGTNYIVVLIVIFSIAAFFLAPILTLSLYGLSQLYLWTIFTSLFVSYSALGSQQTNLFGLFFLFILILFLYNIAKNIEQRFGTKFLIRLYVFCAAFTGLFYVLIRILLSVYYPINFDNVVYVGLATGSMLGLISFMVYFNPNREMMMFCFFIPVKMKGKVLLVILILFRIIPGLFFAIIISPLYLALYLPDLGGILASYLVFYIKFKHRLHR